MRSRTAHADMAMWLSFFEVTPERVVRVDWEEGPQPEGCAYLGWAGGTLGVADIPQRLRIEIYINPNTDTGTKWEQKM